MSFTFTNFTFDRVIMHGFRVFTIDSLNHYASEHYESRILFTFKLSKIVLGFVSDSPRSVVSRKLVVWENIKNSPENLFAGFGQFGNIMFESRW